MRNKIFVDGREMSIAKFEAASGLIVSGSLDLSGTKITSLPDNLTVGDWLDLSGTKITSLPDNLTVGGWLDLSGTGITALPEKTLAAMSFSLFACQTALA